MISDKKASEIVNFCYKVLFLLADPPINFDKILKDNEKGKLKNDWFYDHHLDEKTMTNIITRVGKIYKLKAYEKRQLETTILLGCSPTSVKL